MTQAAKHRTPHIGLVSLGCPKALVDSERLLTQLRAEGYAVSASYRGADLVIVNTCGFIEAAVEESLSAIGEALDENGKVIVTGCLGAKVDLIRQHHPRVLAVTGPHDTKAVMGAVHRHLPPAHQPYFDLIPPQGIKLTPRHYAYLKISEGCNHRCSFCIIPHMRGHLASRPINDVMQEAETLTQAGVRELLVIAQDTSAYGRDLGYANSKWRDQVWRTHFVDLAHALGQLGVWVRLHYVYPYPHVDEVIPLMAAGRILPYLDVPFQHASPSILKAMRRPANNENTLSRIKHWREMCPELTLRSTFIVGFPGETEDDFEKLLEFLQEAQLDRVGCFPYSPVAGAAANHLPDALAEDIKQERLQRLMAVQAQISAARLKRRVGSTVEVLADEVTAEGLIARSGAEAPDVDGLIYVRAVQSHKVGERLRVEITASTEHDLYARAI